MRVLFRTDATIHDLLTIFSKHRLLRFLLRLNGLQEIKREKCYEWESISRRIHGVWSRLLNQKTVAGEKWHQRRKMLTPAFHYSILKFVIDVVRRNSEVLIKNLEAEENSDGFDVVPYISTCSLDIIGGG